MKRLTKCRKIDGVQGRINACSMQPFSFFLQQLCSTCHCTTIMSASVLIFGDQNVDKVLALRSLDLIARKHLLLQRFLEEAAVVVSQQIRAFFQDERALFGTFASLPELADRYFADGCSCEAVGGVLLVAVQIGQLML